MSQNISNSQKTTLITLSTITLILAIAWFIIENTKTLTNNVNLEPLVVIFASSIPIFSLWWPFHQKYRSKRISDTVTLDLDHHKTAQIGSNEAQFKPYFSTNSETSVHLLTRLHPDNIGSAIAGDANRFSDIKNATSYELSNEDKSPSVNDIVIIKNRYGNYALLKILSIETSRPNHSGNIIKIEYIINPTGGINFS